MKVNEGVEGIQMSQRKAACVQIVIFEVGYEA